MTTVYKYRITEKDFQDNVLRIARLNNWLCYHTHDSRRSEPGFPDLVLVHEDGRLLFRELKTSQGRLTKAQELWIELLSNAGSDIGVWRPEDMDSIVEQLRRKP